VVQPVFLLPDWRQWPRILRRDSRIAAAVVLDPDALSSQTPWPRVLAAATGVHFLGAWLDAATLAAVLGCRRQNLPALLATGALYGTAAYGVRLYALAPWYPWMRRLRTPAYLLTHVAHGIVTALALRGRRP
jgi:hypothetical protein